MRYRRLDENGDMTFGQGENNFLINSPACVAQSILTRLMLWRGEWFVDTAEGTPWMTDVLGTNTKPLFDLAIQQRVLRTLNVRNIVEYASAVVGRRLSVSMTVTTAFSTTPVAINITLP